MYQYFISLIAEAIPAIVMPPRRPASKPRQNATAVTLYGPWKYSGPRMLTRMRSTIVNVSVVEIAAVISDSMTNQMAADQYFCFSTYLGITKYISVYERNMCGIR